MLNLSQTKSYFNIAALNVNFVSDFSPSSSLNSIGLTQNCGYGLCPPPKFGDIAGQVLVQDYTTCLKFHGIIPKTVTDPTAAVPPPGAILDLLERRTVEVIPDEQKTGADTSRIPKFHFEILKRAYHREVGLTPNNVLSNAISLFNPNIEIQHTTKKHLYYNPYQRCFNPAPTTPHTQNWILITEGTIRFIDKTSRLGFKNELSYRTEAILSIEETSCPVDLRKGIELDNYINTHYKDGFILRKIEITGPSEYRYLFDSFINWDRTKCPDFRQFIIRDLLSYLTNSQAYSDASLLKQWPSPEEFQQTGTKDRIKYRNNDTALALKIKTATKLHLLLTPDSLGIKFTPEEETALSTNELGKITRNLCFVIGLRDPRLYKSLDRLHQNPLEGSLSSILRSSSSSSSSVY